MSFQIKPIKDIPEEDAKLLGHDRIVTNLKTFLEHENMITPLSIAIHGDWGSGKTSIMKTLQNKLDTGKFEVVFFEAWKYEYANPSLGLISELATKYATNTNAIKSILKAAIYILTNQYLGFDSDKVISIISQSKTSVENLSKQLQTIIKDRIRDKKLIIILDDLDRCDVENALQLLAIIKLFLDLENCICVAAVDFNRLKQAWQTKYGANTKQNNGSEYLDKIFQIRLGIPRPPHDQIEKYVQTLIENLPAKAAKLFALTLPKNPRAIKRIMNLIAFRQNLVNSHYKAYSAIFWTLLEEIIGNDKITLAYEKIISNGGSFGNLIVDTGRSWATIKDFFERSVDPALITFHAEKLSQFFALSYDVALEDQVEKTNINDDFQILYLATNEANR